MTKEPNAPRFVIFSGTPLTKAMWRVLRRIHATGPLGIRAAGLNPKTLRSLLRRDLIFAKPRPLILCMDPSQWTLRHVVHLTPRGRDLCD